MARSEAVTDGEPIVQAHRGFAGVAPENTVRAARTAAERFDADWVEVDVQPTADDVVVCFHDPALGEREGSRAVTDATGLVRDASSERVLAAEVLDSGETVPRLAEVFAALPADVGVNVELKSPGGAVDDGWPSDAGDWLFDDTKQDLRTLWNEFVTDVAAVVAEADRAQAADAGRSATADGERPVVLSSFWEGALAAAAEHAPEIPRAIIVGGDLEDGLAIAKRHDAVALNAPVGLLKNAGAPFVERAHEADLAVNAWTLTEWTEYRDVAAVGVDGVIADYPFLDATL